MSNTALPSRLHPETAAHRGGLLAAAALAWPASRIDAQLGTGILYGITAFSVCAVAGVLVADALRPRPQGTVRRARLGRRRVRDHLPRRPFALLAAQAVVLVALLTGALVAGSADDMGRAGRALTVVCPRVTETVGPWPGSYYGLPMLGLLASGTGLSGWTLRRIALTAAGDDAGHRRRSRSLIAAWGLLVTTPLAGVALFMGGAMRSISCLGGPLHALGWALIPVALLAAVSAVWCLVTLAFPRTPGDR